MAYYIRQCARLPIDDALLVQELEAGNDFGRIEFRARLRKATAHLDVEHQIAAVQVLHHEEQMTLFGRAAEIHEHVRLLRVNAHGNHLHSVWIVFSPAHIFQTLSHLTSCHIIRTHSSSTRCAHSTLYGLLACWQTSPKRTEYVRRARFGNQTCGYLFIYSVRCARECDDLIAKKVFDIRQKNTFARMCAHVYSTYVHRSSVVFERCVAVCVCRYT